MILKSAEEGDFLANAIPFPPSYHTLRNLCITRKTRTRDVTALDDETFPEKKENKKTSDQKKEKAPLKFYSQLKRTKKEREIRERKRKI